MGVLQYDPRPSLCVPALPTRWMCVRVSMFLEKREGVVCSFADRTATLGLRGALNIHTKRRMSRKYGQDSMAARKPGRKAGGGRREGDGVV